MKILHCADLHMDSPFDALTVERAAIRRGEQRGLLERLVELCESRGIEVLLLAGDLLDSTASFHETHAALVRAFGQIRAKVFIAPGNHDYFCLKSPYAYIDFPANVHIFKSPEIECVELPELGCRIWGAGFTAPNSNPLLRGFTATESDMLNIMVLHGDTGGDAYNHITQQDIAGSNLDYLALGHVHTYSGVKVAGHTHYAYPGCPEGRGFDETGKKGVLAGEVTKKKAELEFIPLGGREYRILEVDLTDTSDVKSAIEAAIRDEYARDVCRIVLTGEYDGELNINKLADAFSDRVFSLTVRDRTKPRRDIWEDADEDSLRGLFLRSLHEKLGSADSVDRETITLAANYGLAALMNAEEWRL